MVTDPLTDLIRDNKNIQTTPQPDGSTLVWLPAAGDAIQPLRESDAYTVEERGTSSDGEDAYRVAPVE